MIVQLQLDADAIFPWEQPCTLPMTFGVGQWPLAVGRRADPPAIRIMTAYFDDGTGKRRAIVEADRAA